MKHHWIWMNELQGGKLRRVGSACVACGCRMYGWGGFAGACVAADTSERQPQIPG